MRLNIFLAIAHSRWCGVAAPSLNLDAFALNSLVVDGVFGNLTNVAGMAFQKQYGLTIDGIGGDETWAVIDTIVRATLCFGSTGKDVEYLQRRLNGIGFGSLVVDGIFGVATEEAVKKFQKYYGLTVDGIVGSQTWAKLETIDV